jgi:RHS repeat-associated protein
VLTDEGDSLVKEKGNFANIESVRTDEKGENSDYSVRVSAYSPAVVSKVLRVEQGGSLSLRAAAKYEESKSILLKNNKLSSFKAKDLLPVLAVTPVNVANSETKNYAIGVNILGLVPITKKIVNVIKAPIITPKKLQNAVIEISFYKDSLLQEQIFSKQLSVSENAAYDWEVLKDSLTFESDGFAVVTLRNANSLPVLFDNLEIRTYGTEKAVIIQENHYEPFGMTLKGLDYVVNPQQKNQFLFNGKELDESLDLQLYDYHARQVDPQTGRFNQIDPHAHKYANLSGYAYVANNPMKFIDPNGKDIVDPKGKKTTYEVNKDGSLKWSANATKDVIRVGNAMAKTEVGLQTLKDMNDAKHSISITVDTKEKRKDEKGIPIYGFATNTVKNNTDGSKTVVKSDIIIYEANFQALYDKKAADGKDRGFMKEGVLVPVTKHTMDENIGATGTHEGTHAIDTDSMSSYHKDNPKMKNSDFEVLPNKNEFKFYQQLNQAPTTDEKK